MFTLPPLPPKDYYIRQVNQNQVSCQEHTPWTPVRVTLPTVAHFCAPIPYGKNDRFEKIQIEEPHPLIVDKWTDNAKADWFIKPGIDDYLVHDIFKNYTVKDQPNYKMKYKNVIFPRPYLYDIHKKNRIQRLDPQTESTEINENEELNYVGTFKRWQEQPDLSTQRQTDPCKRREDLALVGSCFKNEILNWYYRNYPPPKFR